MSVPFKKIVTYTPTGNATQYERAYPDHSRLSMITIGQRTRTDSFDVEVRDRMRVGNNNLVTILEGQSGGNPEGSGGFAELLHTPGHIMNLEETRHIQIHHEQSPFNADTIDVGFAGELPGDFPGPSGTSLMTYSTPTTVTTVEMEVPRRCHITAVYFATIYTAPAFTSRVYNADPSGFDNDNPANKHLVMPAIAATVFVPGIVARRVEYFSAPGYPYESETGEDKIWVNVGSVPLGPTPLPNQMLFRIDYAPWRYD